MPQVSSDHLPRWTSHQHMPGLAVALTSSAPIRMAPDKPWPLDPRSGLGRPVRCGEWMERSFRSVWDMNIYPEHIFPIQWGAGHWASNWVSQPSNSRGFVCFVTYKMVDWNGKLVPETNWLVVWNMFYFSIQLGMSSSQLTTIFQRGWNHQPDTRG